MQARLIGLAVLAFGVLLGWAFAPVAYQSTFDPLYDVAAFIIATLAVLFGLLLLVGGERLYTIINSAAKTSAQQRTMTILYALAAVAAIGAALWYNRTVPIF